jgi:hypothetical protein
MFLVVSGFVHTPLRDKEILVPAFIDDDVARVVKFI